MVWFNCLLCTGEFGVVYRAKLLRKQGRNKTELVAVKTMRGLFELETVLATSSPLV